MRTVGMFIACLALGTIANAQATRTWVSGVGDDANPCSRTAPCKTFAGAISKTAAGGEISVLDPGGFGAVTITKSITINGDGTLAGILAASGSGIIVNAGANDVVIIRNISIAGANQGSNGIRYLAGRHLRVENCWIYGFTARGIDMVHSGTGAGELSVKNTSITNVGTVGIRVQATLGSPATSLNGVNIQRAQIGFDVINGTATISDSVLSHITNQAVVAEQTASINAVGCVLSNNGTGVAALGNGSSVRISNCDIYNNATGINIGAGGTVASANNNRVFANGASTAPNGSITVQ